MISDYADIFPLGNLTPNDEEWHALRGIGGSAVGAIVGLTSKYVSKYSLWAEMTGRVKRQGSSSATAWGNRLEDVVGLAYAEEEGVAVVKWNVALRSKERPWATANVDFWLCDDAFFEPGKLHDWEDRQEPPGIYAILETKTAGIATHGTAHKWDDGAIPDSYALQAVHYGIVSGVHDLRFGALLGGQGLACRALEWDDDLAEDVIALEDEFWECIQNDVPPDVDGSEATEEALKQQFPRHAEGTVLEGGEYLAKLWDDLEVKKKIEADAISERKQARAKIVSLMGANEVGAVDGVPILSFKAGQDQKWFDEAAFERENPTEYKKYLKKKPGPRMVRRMGKKSG